MEGEFTNFRAMHQTLRDHKILVENYGVEVGVAEGTFSRYLIDHNPKLKMYLVDSYPAYTGGGGDFYTQFVQDQVKARALEAMKPYVDEGRAVWIMKDSITASFEFLNKSVDFVFIDADHCYEAMREDLKAWYPKVRDGGLLSGHDYNLGGVRMAVDEFRKNRHLGKLTHIGGSADVWFIEV